MAAYRTYTDVQTFGKLDIASKWVNALYML